MVCDFLVQPVGDIRGLLRWAYARSLALCASHNVCTRHLCTMSFAFNSYHGDIVDRFTINEKAFKLCRSHLEALVLDQLLGPVCDVKVTLFVLVTNIAGSEPPIGRETTGCGLG